jgi:surface polysaccharide O-acyltransferase-like enzyme
MSSSPKIAWANNLRAAATIGVIFIHSSSYLTGSFRPIPQSYWMISIVINTLVRWAVPVFVMLTGSFVLANYNNQPRPFFIKAFKKIIIPFLIWSMVYLLYYNWETLLSNSITNSQKWALILDKMVTGTAVHLWYIYMIAGMYLLIPIIANWTKDASEKQLRIFILFWFILLIAYPWIDQYKNDFELGFFTGYVGYLISGYYFFKHISVPKWILWGSLILSCILISSATIYLGSQKNVDHEMFLAPLTPGIFIMSASVYLLFKQSTVSLNSWLAHVVNWICDYSFGIYLVHLLVLSIIDDKIMSIDGIHPLISIPIVSVLCLIFSFSFIYLLRRVPIIGKWVG